MNSLPEIHHLTHIDQSGAVRMVDISKKSTTTRVAIARCAIRMSSETFDVIIQEKAQKGNVIEVARIAGIMAAKKTADLIPLCHPLSLSQVQVDFFPSKKEHFITIQSMVKTHAQTGAEMEALTAVSIAALTVYDMCKAIDKGMVIDAVCLVKKTGGKSGVWERTDDTGLGIKHS